MIDSSTTVNMATYIEALAQAGRNERLRNTIMEALRLAETSVDEVATFRKEVRWPILHALLRDVPKHRVVLTNGLIFEVGLDSRIEQAFLMSSSAHPDHVWEPQTTKLLVALGANAVNVIVGGAYIGDHVLLIARAMLEANNGGMVHAFEPMESVFQRLLRHLDLNAITNVSVCQLALWDESGVALSMDGPAALTSYHSVEHEDQSKLSQAARSMTIDDYVDSQQLSSVNLVMLDIEGGEEKALAGASKLLARPFPEAPHLIFEVHRKYVDWSDGLESTSIVNYVRSKGYTVYAIRDFHDNYPMANKTIEVIPVDRIYLEGPPHGFNLLATKDPDLITRLGLCIVENVSPKLLVDRDPLLHHPIDGL